jgi:hypothetical protein
MKSTVSMLHTSQSFDVFEKAENSGYEMISIEISRAPLAC